jgi:hypothetical protein
MRQDHTGASASLEGTRGVVHATAQQLCLLDAALGTRDAALLHEDHRRRAIRR